MTIGFDIAELQSINLGPNDVLSAKLVGDEFDQETAHSLREMLKNVFPNNQVIVFTMPNGTDIVLEAIRPEQKAESKEQNYCDNCNCGKKQESEGA